VEAELFGETLTGDPADPAFIGECLAKLFKEVHVATNACAILMQAMMSILASFDALDNEANIRFTGQGRQIFRDQVQKCVIKLGPHPLLTEMEKLCGREPLKLVDADSPQS
jgi:hypothetical protein